MYCSGPQSNHQNRDTWAHRFDSLSLLLSGILSLRVALHAELVSLPRFAVEHGGCFLVAEDAFGFGVPLDRSAQTDRDVGQVQRRGRAVLGLDV